MTNDMGTTCGAGTHLLGGQCVVNETDGQSSSDGGHDANVVDGATNGDGTSPGPDANVVADASATFDVQAVDGSPAESDPCPDSSLPALWADCSDQCVGQTAFDAGTCGTSGNYALVCPRGYSSGTYTYIPNHDFTLRTPAEVVSACETQCATSAGPSVTASMVFAFPAASLFTIEVAAPWKVTALAVATLEAGTLISCEAPGGPVSSGPCVNAHNGLFIIWTDDPDPPARNIVFRWNAQCP